MSEPLRLIDTHAHLALGQFDADREAAIVRASEAGVARIVEIGYDLPSSHAAIALATANAEAIEAFGTAELDALVQRFKDDSANNDSLVAEFTQGLDLVEQQLADIERQIKL